MDFIILLLSTFFLGFLIVVVCSLFHQVIIKNLMLLLLDALLELDETSRKRLIQLLLFSRLFSQFRGIQKTLFYKIILPAFNFLDYDNFTSELLLTNGLLLFRKTILRDSFQELTIINNKLSLKLTSFFLRILLFFEVGCLVCLTVIFHFIFQPRIFREVDHYFKLFFSEQFENFQKTPKKLDSLTSSKEETSKEEKLDSLIFSKEETSEEEENLLLLLEEEK